MAGCPICPAKDSMSRRLPYPSETAPDELEYHQRLGDVRRRLASITVYADSQELQYLGSVLAMCCGSMIYGSIQRVPEKRSPTEFVSLFLEKFSTSLLPSARDHLSEEMPLERSTQHTRTIAVSEIHPTGNSSPPISAAADLVVGHHSFLSNPPPQ